MSRYGPSVCRHGQAEVHFGIVEDDKDPHKCGSYRVRLPEHGGPEKVAKDDLPWSVPKASEGPNHQKVGTFRNLPPGTKVAVMMLDGPAGLMPMIIGPGGQAVGGEAVDGVTKNNATQYEIAKSSLPSPVQGGEENDVNFWLNEVPPEDPTAGQPSNPKSEVV